MFKLIKIFISSFFLVAILCLSGCNEVKDTLKPIMTPIENMFSGSSKKLNTSGINIPMIRGVVPDGLNINGQFVELEKRFVMIKYNNTKLYQSPEEVEQSVNVLDFSYRVRIIYKKPGVLEINKKEGQWVFVTDETGESPLGWVPTHFLLFPEDFKRTTSWTAKDFSLCKGQYCAEYEINSNGSFINRWISSGGGIFLKGVIKGHLFRFGNLFWAKSNDALVQDFVILSKDQKLSLEESYKKYPFRVGKEEIDQVKNKKKQVLNLK